MAEWLRLILDSLETWVRVLHVDESFCRAAAILRGTVPVSALTPGKYPQSIPHSSVEVEKIEECCIHHSGRFFTICIPLTCQACPGIEGKKNVQEPSEFSINRRENVEENATEASEVSYSADSSSMNLRYTQIFRINITANQMDVQGQRKIKLSKTLSLPGDMK